MDPAKIKHIDLVLQFTLTAAGREDDFKDRELGPIHLIKYLYLADLVYAQEHEGETYTGIAWKFHHFGPWSNEAYARIEPALQEIGAKRRSISSKYEGDVVRWTISDDHLYLLLAEKLPSEVTRPIRKYVHEFNGITEDLLHFVYNTWPMLRARPGAILDFSVPAYRRAEKIAEPERSTALVEKLSFKQRKKKKEALEQQKKQFQEHLEAKMKKPRVKPHPPRYDEIFFEGLNNFESLAGEGIPHKEGAVYFSDDIWESRARFDPDVP